MPYIGRLPSASPLSVDDITDGVVTTAKISDDAVTAAKINGLTASIAELNLTDGITADSTDLNRLDITTVGTAEASKALTTDSSNNITSSNSLTAGSLIGDGSGLTNLPPAGGSTTATANGAITNGDPVIIESAGTVAAIAETSATETLGTPVLFQSGVVSNVASVYDPSSQKVVTVYRDNSNSLYGTAIVGTVSGTSISFGTKVVIATGVVGGEFSATYDANAQKLVVVYMGPSFYGNAVVGTVSGTSISFGTPVVFLSSETYPNVVYDSNAQKVVVAYTDGANSYRLGAKVGTVSGTSISFGSEALPGATNIGYRTIAYDSNAQKVVVAGSHGYAYVGTVSGTSISFGSGVQFETGSINSISSAYDSDAGKVVVTYRDTGNSSRGTAAVGTVSGTSISFGSPVVFESGNTSFVSSTYDTVAKKIVTSYVDNGNSNYGTIISGTVSGTTISFDTESVFETSTINTHPASVYDVNAQKVVTSYQDNGNSSYGTAFVYQTGYTAVNLTAENFIGFVDADYADGATATIQLAGNIDDAQSGLTAGQQYFVQNDGTLGTTASNPSVKAGVALSATEILIDTGRV